MARYFKHQQTYIDELQRQLNQGLADKKYITDHWPRAEANQDWITLSESGSTQAFRVRLKPFGHIWGQAEHEHDAWTAARKALDLSDVTYVFEKEEQCSTLISTLKR